jgi:hypothetical protein
MLHRTISATDVLSLLTPRVAESCVQSDLHSVAKLWIKFIVYQHFIRILRTKIILWTFLWTFFENCKLFVYKGIWNFLWSVEDLILGEMVKYISLLAIDVINSSKWELYLRVEKVISRSNHRRDFNILVVE